MIPTETSPGRRRRRFWPWLTLLAALAATASWLGFRSHLTSRAQAWAVARPFIKMESFWTEARRHAAGFQDPDWRFLMSEATRPESRLEAWLVRNRSALPAWLRARVPFSDSGDRWANLETAWTAHGSTPEPRRLEWLAHARRVDTDRAWRVVALALAGNPSPPTALLRDLRSMLPSLDTRARVVVVAAMDRVDKDALPDARALLDELSRDKDPDVSGNARRMLGRAPYR